MLYYYKRDRFMTKMLRQKKKRIGVCVIKQCSTQKSFKVDFLALKLFLYWNSESRTVILAKQ